MKFLVDEQLPASLTKWIVERGRDAVHATSLGTGVRISDADIWKKSMAEQRIVVTKDIDFLNRFMIKEEPWKLLYLTTGNISNRDLKLLFEQNFEKIEELFEKGKVIEMNRQNLLLRF